MSVLVAALALVAVLVAVIVNALKDDSDTDKHEAVSGDEVGVYYGTGIKECELTLKSGCLFDIDFDGVKEKGSYVLDGSKLRLDFDVEGKEDVVAAYDNGVITMTYKGVAIRMLRKINYTVRFVTDGGTEIADATVLNGKTVPKPADPVKNGFLFIGWYKDAALTSPFTFSADIV